MSTSPPSTTNETSSPHRRVTRSSNRASIASIMEHTLPATPESMIVDNTDHDGGSSSVLSSPPDSPLSIPSGISLTSKIIKLSLSPRMKTILFPGLQSVSKALFSCIIVLWEAAAPQVNVDHGANSIWYSLLRPDHPLPWLEWMLLLYPTIWMTQRWQRYVATMIHSQFCIFNCCRFEMVLQSNLCHMIYVVIPSHLLGVCI